MNSSEDLVGQGNQEQPMNDILCPIQTPMNFISGREFRSDIQSEFLQSLVYHCTLDELAFNHSGITPLLHCVVASSCSHLHPHLRNTMAMGSKDAGCKECS